MSQVTQRASERGSVLVHVAVGLVAIIAFSALAVDFGVLWASRRQAQNAADAAAHAAAEEYSFTSPGDLTAARNAALAVAAQNQIWGQSPDITPADVNLVIPCPPGAPGVEDTCIRADVFRNQRPGGSPLPMFFGQIVGLTQQGVKATATAQLFIGDIADCVKPFAIPDKWQELNPVATTWDPDDEFNKYVKKGNNWIPIPNPDVYTAPSTTTDDPGTGFDVDIDYGLLLTLKNRNPQDAIQPGWFYPVKLTPGENGAAPYRWNIENCNTTEIGPGTVLDLETGDMVGPTRMGMENLYNQDPDAWWDPSANGGKGAPAGGCMYATPPTCTRSPRSVAIAVFDPDLYAQGKTNGSSTVTVTHLVGFWINGIDNQGNVSGYITHYPTTAKGSSSLNPSSSFLRTVILVR